MKKNIILFIVAHTDDETIGSGGTIARHKSLGDKVYAMSFTDGISSRKKNQDKKIRQRLEASKKASKILGFKWIKNLDFPDNELDSVSLIKIIKEIENVKRILKPNIVYTHCFSDLNIDHRIVAQATLTAFRPEPKEAMKELRTFEIPSSTDFSSSKFKKLFSPNIFIPIDKFWKKKLQALKAYNYEMKKEPHSRSLKGIHNLAKIRGNQSGLKLAESFELIRRIY